jgi:ribonuclease BN (tRNA processing enzyme)
MVTLKFLGIGAALNATRGNTSAYFIMKDELFLIDCGCTTFAELMRRGVLNKNIRAIHAFITHTQCDHIASLADLVRYTLYRLDGIPFYIPHDPEHENVNDRMREVADYFNYFRVYKPYNLEYPTSSYEGTIYPELKGIHMLPTTHREDFHSVSIVIRTLDKNIFYSGDTNTFKTLEQAEDKYGPMDEIYLDVCSEDLPMHIYIDRVVEYFPPERRSNVYLMHFDFEETINRVRELGFNVATIS